VVPYQASDICGAILGKARVFLQKEELVGVQDNNDANAETASGLSDFENESELEYTDEEYFNEDDLEIDSEEMNMLVLSTAVPDGIETLVEQEKSDAFTMLMSSARSRGDAVFDTTSFKDQRGPSLSNKQKKRKADDVLAM
jgi:hypothetical protein